MEQESEDVGGPTRISVSGSLPKPAQAASRAPRPAVTIRSLTLFGEDRQRLIAEAAYFRAEQRGFIPGHELADWLAAEIDIDALLGDDRVE